MALPPALRKRVARICQDTHRKPLALVREMVAFYEGGTGRGVKKLDVSKLSKEFCDQVQAVAAALRGHLTTGAMTPAQKTARAQAGAAKRNQTLSAEERKKIASEAAKARWKKQTKPE